MWRKASRSVNDANCVEVRHTLDEVRDSKNTAGQTLRIEVRDLTNAIKKGLLNH
jgi:hypothetical protein